MPLDLHFPIASRSNFFGWCYSLMSCKGVLACTETANIPRVGHNQIVGNQRCVKPSRKYDPVPSIWECICESEHTPVGRAQRASKHCVNQMTSLASPQELMVGPEPNCVSISDLPPGVNHSNAGVEMSVLQIRGAIITPYFVL